MTYLTARQSAGVSHRATHARGTGCWWYHNTTPSVVTTKPAVPPACKRDHLLLDDSSGIHTKTIGLISRTRRSPPASEDGADDR